MIRLFVSYASVMFFIFIPVRSPLIARIVNVPDDYITIQSAIDEAAMCDTILVQEGLYYELIDYSGKTITVTSTYAFDGDTSSILQTIIDGDSSRTGGGSVVSFVNGEDSSSVLCGFTIRNGIGTYTEEGATFGYIGGGIYSIDASPTIIHNIIMNNTADALPIDGGIGRGGGLFLSGGSPLIIGNVIMNNYAFEFGPWIIEGEGGGIYLDYCMNTLIDDNKILQNESGTIGAAIYTSHSNVMISNNVIKYNYGSGAISCRSEYYIGLPIVINGNEISHNERYGMDIGAGYYSDIKNNVIYGNATVGLYCGGANSYHKISSNTICSNGTSPPSPYDAGMVILSDINVEIENNICANNIGYGIRTQSENPLVYINYNDVWNNSNGQYCNIDPGGHDISCDPQFNDTTSYDYSLNILSPCIDAGDPASSDTLRISGDRIDIGAYEYIQLIDDYDLFTFGPNLDLAKKGSTRNWNYSVFNPLPFPVTIDIWFEYSGPECGIAETILDKSIAPNSGYQGTIEVEVPDSLGSYTVKGRIGDYQAGIWDSDVFDLVVYKITLDPNVGTNTIPVQSNW